MNKNREPEKNEIDIARDAGQIDIARDAGQIDIARDAGQIDIARGGGKYERGDSLVQVKASLEFLERATADDGARSRLENAAGHEEVIRLAKESGYEISRESLAEAMKIFVDRRLETSGIPSWVRARIVAPVHD